eukprot:CAMPEP_0197624788 /NCGR_PEP_ID=MMETSP1338-20131121/4328_1 /TAXON_ID=43686 ORGANISM="Pelagodinium beii, Strain RCC1491" /NCGR_SAMPLE_ID=MMETSP1338 /ASSEMBLY_ACC=CAM_ASM_000754 /LENGTH=51 /DNA_ID=CAMNT_0043195017 /DNA_START=404 /DNA_END=559 /DNA_ORIENTATION=-
MAAPLIGFGAGSFMAGMPGGGRLRPNHSARSNSTRTDVSPSLVMLFALAGA